MAKSKLPSAVSAYLSALGKRGGAAGKGVPKRNGSANARAAALAMHARRRKKNLEKSCVRG